MLTANLLGSVLVVGLAALCGWLTWRAIRARRAWVKIARGFGAGLLALLFLFIAFNGAKGLAIAYIPRVPFGRAHHGYLRYSRSGIDLRRCTQCVRHILCKSSCSWFDTCLRVRC
jgi:hypothetical protein